MRSVWSKNKQDFIRISQETQEIVKMCMQNLGKSSKVFCTAYLMTKNLRKMYKMQIGHVSIALQGESKSLYIFFLTQGAKTDWVFFREKYNKYIKFRASLKCRRNTLQCEGFLHVKQNNIEELRLAFSYKPSFLNSREIPKSLTELKTDPRVIKWHLLLST